MVTFIIMAGVLLLVILIGLIPVTAEMKAEYQKNPAGLLKLELHTIIKDFKKEIPYEGLSMERFMDGAGQKKTEPTKAKTQENKKAGFSFYYRFFKKLAAFIHIKQMKWHTHIGRDDAMDTALLTGSLWALKGSLLGIITGFFPVHKVDLQVYPVFSQNVFSSQFHCTLQARIASLLLIGLWLTGVQLLREIKVQKNKLFLHKIGGVA